MYSTTAGAATETRSIVETVIAAVVVLLLSLFLSLFLSPGSGEAVSTAGEVTAANRSLVGSVMTKVVLFSSFDDILKSGVALLVRVLCVEVGLKESEGE